MNALVNTLIAALHQPHGRQEGSTMAMDLFVLATLGFLFFLLGCFATWAWLIWRRSTRPEPHVKLLMEMEERETETKGEMDHPKETKQQKPAEEEEAAPWERPGDWWKQ